MVMMVLMMTPGDDEDRMTVMSTGSDGGGDHHYYDRIVMVAVMKWWSFWPMLIVIMMVVVMMWCDGDKDAADKNDDGENATHMQVEPMDFCDRRAFLRPLDISVYKFRCSGLFTKVNFRVQSIPLEHSSHYIQQVLAKCAVCVCLCVGVRSHTAVSYYVPGPMSPGPREWVVVVSLRDAAEVPGDEGNVSWATQHFLFGEANEVGFKAQTGTATVTRQKQVGTGKATG